MVQAIQGNINVVFDVSGGIFVLDKNLIKHMCPIGKIEGKSRILEDTPIGNEFQVNTH